MSEPSQSETPEQRLAAARSWAESVEPAAPRSGSGGAEMSARVQAVLEAAERAADAIRSDAEEQAQRHLTAAQQKADRMTAERVQLISRLTDDLVQHASVVREHSERMVASLEEAISTVTDRLADDELLSGPPPPSLSIAGDRVEARPSAAPPTAPPDERFGAPAAGTDPPQPSVEAMLRATQLAVAGHGREQIAQTISEEFGIDPGPVLARVLD